MAYVLFVVYIPNEKKETEDAQDAECRGTVEESSEGDTGGEGANVGGVDEVSLGSETPSKTVEERAEKAESEDAAVLEIDTTTESNQNETSISKVKFETAAENTSAESADSSTNEKREETEDETTNKDGNDNEEEDEDEEDEDEDEGEVATLENFLGKGNFAERLKDTLQSLQIQNDVWQFSETFVQISFVEESGTRCEDIITRLSNIGIGREPNSTLSVFPSTVHLKYDADGDKAPEDAKMPNGTYLSDDEKENEFMMSVKSRLTVAQVVSSVEQNARLTFDYVMLIFLASWIAALGLGENSSVVLVASMLISPLMGPILAVIFGTVVKNDGLRNLGLKSEGIGLFICLAFGLLSGFIYAGLGVHGQLLGNSDSWPTSEMSSRGVHRSLVAGVLIAIPSGAGVALSILGGNAGSLVGVAISASLLPPAVNAGMLWSLALSAAIKPPAINTMFVDIGNETAQLLNVSNPTNLEWSCPPFVDNAYMPTYSCNMAVEAGILGTISLLLTFLNILSIFVVGMMVLKLKEVAPHTSPSFTEHFFRKDLKVARESYQTSKGAHSVALGKKFLEEYKKQNLGITEEEEDNDIKENKKTLYFKHVLQKVENDADVRHVIGSLPSSTNTTPFSYQLQPEFTNAERNILQKEDSYYKSFATDNSEVDPKARVYRTIHAYDPHPLSPTSPTLPSFRNRKHQLFKRKSDFFYFEASRPRVASVGSKPKTPRGRGKGKRPKKGLKVKIPDPPSVKFVKEEKTEPKVTFVPIPEGQESMFADQKPRFEVETVDEKEIEGETTYRPTQTPEYEPLLPEKSLENIDV